MIENYNLYYEQLSPKQRIEEMQKLYELLPDFSIWHLEPGSIQKNVITGRLENVRTAEQKRAKEKEIDDILEARKNSEFTALLKARMTALLDFAPVTDSCKRYILIEFEHNLVEGTERSLGEHLEKYADSDLVVYKKKYGWGLEDNFSLFDERYVQDREHHLYRIFANIQLRGLRMEDRLNNATEDDPVFGKLIKMVNELRNQEKLINQLRTPEELEQKRKEWEESELVVEEITGEKRDKDLLATWREEYIERYCDEP